MRASVHSDVEPVADAASAPITIRRRRHALLGGFLLAIAGLWIAVPLKRLLDASAGVPGLGAPGFFGAVMIGMALALLALSWIVRCRVWVIDGGLIRMTERRLTGLRVSEEALARYRGVRCRHERRPNRYGSRNWYVVEAVHPEPAKSIELARSKDPHLIRLCAETWARRLDLPLCQEPYGRPPDRRSGQRELVYDEAGTPGPDRRRRGDPGRPAPRAARPISAARR